MKEDHFDPGPPPRFELDAQEIELLELVVSWGIVGQRPAGEYGHLYQALIAMRRRLRQFHYLRNEWAEAYERVYDTDSPF